MDIAAWLRKVGLERYEQAFRENEVGFDVLPKLTAEDLKEIGVKPVGDRRRLLEAIAALARASASAPLPAIDPAGSLPKPTEAERRQLTVLFCDLVGSTELSARLDPEDMGHLIRAYQTSCAEVVEHWGGHVAKYMGDGVLAYFGWPQAHEDAAERAVRAGLSLTERIARLTGSDGAPLAVRVGIATGLVMVGDLVGEGAAREEAVVGETPNVAARLQALARSGSVVIAQSTRQLLGALFDFDDLGAHDLKGMAAPVRTWRVVAESAAESRFEALRGQRLTTLIGREHELGLLVNRWERAREGEGQVVLLAGEPGIGKSRIVRALRQHLADEPHLPLSHYCSPYHTNTALYPVIGLLERGAGFGRDDPAEARLGKLEALLAQGTEALAEAVSLVANLLGIETGQRYPAPALSPQRRKRRTLEVLVDQVEGLARRQPVLAVYEDVHWVDPTTLELLGLLIERMQRLPVLVLITFRPEFSPPWTGHANVMQLSLSRLTRRHGQALVDAVTGGKSLPDEMLDQIVAKTDGVPLFVEELTKTVVESGLLTDTGDHYTLAGPLLPLAIPTTLQDSLMARLDRLGQVKEVAQIGAVIGREFGHDLLAAVAPLSQDQLRHALDQLVASDLVFPSGRPAEATYSFKHALVQDAAYQSLLKSRRRQLHARIADAMKETAYTDPEVLALHCTEGGLLKEAIVLWQEAGRKASGRSALKETVGHFSKALELLARLPAEPSRLEQELALRTSLGPALIATRGFAAPEVGHTYARAQELCGEIGQHPGLFPALWGSWVFHTVRADIGKANELGDQLLKLARRAGDEDLILQAHHALETSLFWSGRFAEALEHMRSGLAIYDLERHRPHAAVYGGHDPGVCCLAFQSLAMWICGFFDQAENSREQAISLAGRLEHPGSLAHAHQLACRLDVLRRDPAAAVPKATALAEFASVHGFPHPLAVAQMVEGWSVAKQGRIEAGIARVREGMDVYEQTGARLSRSIHCAMLAELLSMSGQARPADELLEAGLAHATESGERFLEAELWRLRGQLLLARDDAEAKSVEAYFRKALDIAREQGARAWELRAATSLARLWADRRRRAEAHDLLAPIYSWFTEGFDTADLKDAKALLDQLA